MAVGVYIDGFNLYYRLFRNDNRRVKVPARYKWLDLIKLSQMLLPREDILHVGYFTAPITRKRSEDQADRQRAYLLALESLPEVEVVFGEFRWVNHMGTLKRNGSGERERFWHWEEKGSDVNIAMRMVRDACLAKYDKLLLISNDSDLVGPVTMVTKEFGIPVIQCSPDINTNKAFIGAASHCQILQTKRLSACTLPEEIVTPAGAIVARPETWI